MKISSLSEIPKPIYLKFIENHWHGNTMVVKGEIVDMSELEGFCLTEGNDITALVTFRNKGEQMEIMSLDSTTERKGYATKLIEELKAYARSSQCRSIALITTNDNIDAIKFYQKLGFEMKALYVGAVNESRKIKPAIPLYGNYGIPIRHEIEFELYL